MPTRIILDQTPIPSSRQRLSPRNNNNSNTTTPGFLASRWVEDEQEEEEEKQEETNSNPSPMHGSGTSGDEGSLKQQQQQQQPNKSKRTRQRRRGQRGQQQQTSSSSVNSMDNEHSTSAATATTPTSRYNKRATSMSGGFRSSLLRELSVRDRDHDHDTDTVGHVDSKSSSLSLQNKIQQQQQQLPRRLSSDDIRASSRFLGYLFCMIASSVLLVSVIQFRNRDTASQDKLADAVEVDIDGEKYFMTANGYLVQKWKLIGAIYIGAVGVISSFLILLAHFDTFCLPRTWMFVFRDGSHGERNLILLLLLFWAAGLHVCTSSLSVGEVQANVYFTTWIAFGSIALNYGVWREAAGLLSLADKVNMHHRETTYNWMWISIFSFIFAGAATDMYFNRTDIELRFQGSVVYLQDSGWVMVLAIVWTEVAVCLLAIMLNETLVEGWELPCSNKRKSGTYRCVFGWRQIEGLVMLLGVSAKVWVIVEYTGVDSVINGVSNAYFGIWGSFFNSVFGLGTWLRENKNIEHFVKEPNDRESGGVEKR